MDMLSNQMVDYNSMCIRISHIFRLAFKEVHLAIYNSEDSGKTVLGGRLIWVFTA